MAVAIPFPMSSSIARISERALDPQYTEVYGLRTGARTAARLFSCSAGSDAIMAYHDGLRADKGCRGFTLRTGMMTLRSGMDRRRCLRIPAYTRSLGPWMPPRAGEPAPGARPSIYGRTRKLPARPRADEHSSGPVGSEALFGRLSGPGLDDGDFRQGGDDGKAASKELAAPVISWRFPRIRALPRWAGVHILFRETACFGASEHRYIPGTRGARRCVSDSTG
jgi:hypothetical protein